MSRVDTGRLDGSAVRARRAVAALFLVNAAAYANVVPRLPAIADDLGLSNTRLGLAVAAMPVGALISGPFAGWLVARVGSGRLTVWCGVGFGLVLPGFAVAPRWAALAAAFFVLGALDSVMDVAMNANALAVQRRLGRSIINGLHGLWSVGAVVGGLAGALAAGGDLALGAHLTVAGASIVLITLTARPFLLPDAVRDPAGVPVAHGIEAPSRPGAAARRLLAMVGLVVVLSAVAEDVPQSWGALLLRNELGASAAVAGLGFIAFQTAMTIGRLLGDRVVEQFGAVAVVRAGGLLIAAGLGGGLAIGTAASMIAGFAVAGVGAAPLFPLGYHAAGDVPGMATGHGVAVVAWMGRVGFLLAPPFVGWIGDASSLRAGLVIAPVAGLGIAALSGAFGRAQPRPPSP